MGVSASRFIRGSVFIALAAASATLPASSPFVQPAGAAPAKGVKEAAREKEGKEREGKEKDRDKESKDPFQRGRDQFAQGRLEESLESFRQAEAKEPKDSIIQAWLGYVLFNLKRYDEAIDKLNRAIELSPNREKNPANIDTYSNLGNAYLGKGDTDKAIESYQKAIDLMKDRDAARPDPYYNLGNARVQKGDLPGALNAYLEAEKLSPDDALIQNNLGYVYEQLNHKDPQQNPLAPALDHYRRATELQPNRPDFHRNYGLALRTAGKRDDAVKELQRSSDLDKGDFGSHLALALEYQNKNQADLAIREYKAALDAKNDFVPRYNLGLLYARQADTASGVDQTRLYGSALDQLKEASRLRPQDERVLSALGWVSFKAKRLDDAASYYEKAIQVSSGRDQARSFVQAAHANLGQIEEARNNKERATQHYREALALDANDVQTRALLASRLLYDGHYEEAAAEYRTVVQRPGKGIASSYNNLGFALEKLGKLQDAAAAYEQAIAAKPDRDVAATAHNNLGAIFERQGEREKARQQYQKALDVDPGNADALRNLKRLSSVK
jgi:tetratricopeptide (TPR) repeat protein